MCCSPSHDYEPISGLIVKAIFVLDNNQKMRHGGERWCNMHVQIKTLSTHPGDDGTGTSASTTKFFVHDGGQVVSVLAFYSDDQNSNPAYV